MVLWGDLWVRVLWFTSGVGVVSGFMVSWVVLQ